MFKRFALRFDDAPPIFVAVKLVTVGVFEKTGVLFAPTMVRSEFAGRVVGRADARATRARMARAGFASAFRGNDAVYKHTHRPRSRKKKRYSNY